MRSPALRVVVVTAVLALGATACGASDEGDNDKYKVELGDFTVRATSPSPKPGTVTIEVTNKGGYEHELVVMRTSPDKIEVNAEGEADEESVPEADHMGEVEHVKPGTSGSFTVTLTAGHYTMFCNLADNEKGGVHYKKGMKAEFDVAA